MPADQVTDFDALYGAHCVGCHGADGKLGPAPPLNDPIFLAIVPDADLRHVISEGARSRRQRTPDAGLRPRSGGPLTDAQVKVLAEGIKKRWAGCVRGSVAAVLGPAATKSGDLDAGARVFARACAGCHGPQGQGGKDAAAGAHQRTGVPGADQRPGAPAHHHHRPARSRHAGLRTARTAGPPISSR